MKKAENRTYSVNIREQAADRFGITIVEQPMIDPVAGVLVCLGDDTVMHLNSRGTEIENRMAIAQALAACIKEGAKVNVIVGRTVPKDIDAIARRLIMPEASFRREELRLRNFGALRFSILSSLFLVPLAEVMLRVKDLDLLEN